MGSRRSAGLVVAVAVLLGGCEGRGGEPIAGYAGPRRAEGGAAFDGLTLVAAPGEPGTVILCNVGDAELELSGLRLAALDDAGWALPSTAVAIEGDGMLDPGEERPLSAPGPRVALLGPQDQVLLRASHLGLLSSR